MTQLIIMAQACQALPQMISQVNQRHEPVIIKSAQSAHKGAVLIGEDDWRAIQETLYLERTSTGAVIRQREKDSSGWTDLDSLDWEHLS